MKTYRDIRIHSWIYINTNMHLNITHTSKRNKGEYK
jgi:hypothetical protein